MDKPREPSSRAGAAGRKATPPAVVLGGFLLLLALVFAGSYALGAAVGPMGPPADPPTEGTTHPSGDPRHGGHR
ncbi:hypothetical protein AQF52_0320 [Streptomyces venezuelae]|uniref:hypothetical protein n=1 Tax=Streptomyces gardneri TaxID=66892 RepID=UPI0006BD9870|nr:hypothetical protein [Streptomyces gardneri]ALO05920.1 hypothetical protein AQF52_0320 [Streptomyces venezuelae]QPK43440.1 hypothetical protein H4W23_01525 [Streptomyces gardneri]WRK34671.1 hypothetical protein U0M97_01535 [Streptomyces venezuelae]CUM43862.1 hypothetical protein BN2537_16689 [Streptomyces venezuelae]